MQGDTGIQGIQGVKGAQVPHKYFILAALHYIFLVFSTWQDFVLFLKGGKGVKGLKGKVSCDSIGGASATKTLSDDTYELHFDLERKILNGSFGASMDTWGTPPTSILLYPLI